MYIYASSTNGYDCTIRVIKPRKFWFNKIIETIKITHWSSMDVYFKASRAIKDLQKKYSISDDDVKIEQP